MSIEHILAPEDELNTKLETYQGVHREFYTTRRRLEYLGMWLFQLSGELGILRWKIAQHSRNEQLEVFDKDEYFEDDNVVL